ncbi:MAG: ECF transporter S component [Clostridia bacterium]|nr:ECF transporter S component [Clostridia bacterium]
MKPRFRAKEITTLAVFAAVAFVAMVTIKIPIVQWLKYEPKDIILVIASFIYGPVAGFMAVVAVSVVEMLTVSDTAFIGLAMNILASGTYCCVASFIYSRRRTLSGAIIGLAVASALTVAAMLLWNWLITPIYMGVPRQTVVDMLVPIFLPFNAVKVVINSAVTLLIYNPIVTAMRKAHLLPPRNGSGRRKLMPVVLTMVGAGVLLIIATALIITTSSF